MQTLLDIYCMKPGFSFVQVSKAHYNGGKVLDASPRWWYNVIKKKMMKPIRIRDETYTNKDGYKTELPSSYCNPDQIFNNKEYATYYWEAIKIRFEIV